MRDQRESFGLNGASRNRRACARPLTNALACVRKIRELNGGAMAALSRGRQPTDRRYHRAPSRESAAAIGCCRHFAAGARRDAPDRRADAPSELLPPLRGWLALARVTLRDRRESSGLNGASRNRRARARPLTNALAGVRKLCDRFFPEFSGGSTSIQVFLRYRCDVPVELGDGGSRFNDPPPTSEPTERTRHRQRIADQAIPWRVAPGQSPPPLHLTASWYRIKSSDIAVIPEKTFQT